MGSRQSIFRRASNTSQRAVRAFDCVAALGLALPGVEAATNYAGWPVLKLGGAFMAGLASHYSAEPETLIVRIGLDDRDALLEDAPDTYYVTDYYRPHPVVLVRLSHIDRDALHDLLAMSWRLTLPKARTRRVPAGRRPRYSERRSPES